MLTILTQSKWFIAFASERQSQRFDFSLYLLPHYGIIAWIAYIQLAYLSYSFQRSLLKGMLNQSAEESFLNILTAYVVIPLM